MGGIFIYCISFRSISFVQFILKVVDFFIDSDNKFMVFSNFVVDCGTKLKLARM
jgi:hypothetical protein